VNDWAVSADTATDNYVSYNEVQIRRTRNGGMDSSRAAADILDALPFSEQFYVHFEKRRIMMTC